MNDIKGPALSGPAATGDADPALDVVLEDIRRDAEHGGLLRGIQETIHLTIDDRVIYTVTVREGRAAVARGATPGIAPTLTVAVTPDALRNLRAAVADGKLEPAELFNVAHVLLVPCLRRIHAMFYFTEPGDKSRLLVDDHMQFVITNPSGFTYHGQKVDLAATVLNVDGYFFYLRGLIGDPDVRYQLTFDDALALYRILVYDAESQRGHLLELKKLGEKTEAILKRSVIYERSWH